MVAIVIVMIVVLEGDDDDESDDFCLEKLNLEIERLREIMRAIIRKVIEECNWLFFGINVWFLCMNVMDFSSLQKTDEIYELLSQEVFRLQELYKMIEFERKGIPSTSPLSKFIPTTGRKMEKILLAQFS
ncbi:hypothetical protein Glove_233g14 [Diversispora epigaea]|uniref:Uncharacterized protein n=1 Tax=Diversispora epigaea TaxID=1348612 RepID=A0A397IGY2_9GLOM|nr:hypothetical protein Glove_233g14 [Diversispora epigaea]